MATIPMPITAMRSRRAPASGAFTPPRKSTQQTAVEAMIVVPRSGSFAISSNARPTISR